MTDETTPAPGSAAPRWDLNAFAQTMGIKGKTAVVQLQCAHGREGMLGFQEGRLVDAQLDELRGEEAFFNLFLMDHLQLIAVHERAPAQRTIETPLTHLLMEAHWRAEERQQQRLLSTQEYTFEEIQAMLRAESLRATTETARVLPRPNIGQAREVKQQRLATQLASKLPQQPNTQPNTQPDPLRLRELERELDRITTSETVVPELSDTLSALGAKLPHDPRHTPDEQELRELAHALARLSTTATRLPELDESTIALDPETQQETAEQSPLSRDALLHAEEDTRAEDAAPGLRWALREPPAMLTPLCQGVLRLPGCLWASLIVRDEVRWHEHPRCASEQAADEVALSAQSRAAFRTLRPTTTLERMVLVEGDRLFMIEEIPAREGAFICLTVTTAETTLAATWWALGQLMEEARIVAESGGGHGAP